MFISRDGHWRVHDIVLDGRELLRVEHDTVIGTPLTHAPRQGAGGWFWVGDFSSINQVAEWVPLANLTEDQETR
jgi:hypothetical protein